MTGLRKCELGATERKDTIRQCSQDLLQIAELALELGLLTLRAKVAISSDHVQQGLKKLYKVKNVSNRGCPNDP